MNASFQLTLPIGAKILDIQLQHDVPCIWVLHEKPDIMNCQELYNLQWFGTGWDIPDKASHIGTVHRNGFVWHLFRI